MVFKKGQHPWNYRTKGLYKKSNEALAKLKENAKNNPNYGMKGKKHKEETIKKQSLAKIGKKQTDETKKKRSDKLKGRITSPNTLFAKDNKVNLNRTPSEETRYKMKNSHVGLMHSGLFKIGNKINNGIKRTPEEIEKNRQAHLGEKCFFWKGGIAYNPYPVDWTESLKRAIRERDHYICQVCSNYGNEVHHINYNKIDCNPNNLITLCSNCHSKTGFDREKWKEFFKNREFFNNFNN